MAAQVTLITGASRGIGRRLAEHFCKAGHQVVGCSRREPDWQHERYRHVGANVSDEQDVKAVFRTVRKEYGRLDNLINNAGVASMNHSLLTPLESVHKVLDTNVVGCFLFCREAAKLMKKNQHGRIVNFSTVAVPFKLEGESVYVASKAAVQGLTEVLSREFADYGITVNTVGPVPIETDLIRSVPRDKIEKIVRRQAIKRMGTFDDVVNVVAFFLKPESNFVTGQHVFLGGP